MTTAEEILEQLGDVGETLLAAAGTRAADAAAPVLSRRAPAAHSSTAEASKPKPPPADLTPTQQSLYDALDAPADLDTLLGRCDLDAATASPQLTLLQMRKHVRKVGARFERC